MTSTCAAVVVTLVICTLTVYGRPGNMMQYEGAAFLRHELARFMSLAQTRDQRECLQDVMRGANEELDRMEQEYDTQNMEEEEKLHKSAKYADSSGTLPTPSPSGPVATLSSSEEKSPGRKESGYSEHNYYEKRGKYKKFLEWMRRTREEAAQCVQ